MAQVCEAAFFDSHGDGDGGSDQAESGEGFHGGRLEEIESPGDLKNGRRV